MANLNTEEIKKLKKGELCGLIALICAGISCVALIVLFAIAIAKADNDLRVYASLTCLPVGVFSLAAAICNLKFGKTLDRLIKNYVQEVFIENAALMHPEKDGLTYYISYDGSEFFVKANNFKEQVVFDFSSFGKLSAAKKSNIFNAIVERLEATFCKLAERGGKYKSVAYCAIKGGKQSKAVSIIENGTPDKKTYKNYLKQQ